MEKQQIYLPDTDLDRYHVLSGLVKASVEFLIKYEPMQATDRHILFKYNKFEEDYRIFEYYSYPNAAHKSLNITGHILSDIIPPTKKRSGQIICSVKVMGQRIPVALELSRIKALFM